MIGIGLHSGQVCSILTMVLAIGWWVPSVAARSQVIRIFDPWGHVVAEIGPTEDWEFEATTATGVDGMRGVLRKRHESGATWRVAFVPSGHLSTPHEPIDSDAILADIQHSVNRQGKTDKIAEVAEVQRWIVPPTFLKSRPALEWALAIRFHGDSRLIVNHAVRVLSRQGHLSLDAAAPVDRAAELSDDASAILALLTLEPGREYSHFDPETEAFAPWSVLDLLNRAAPTPPSSSHSGPDRRAAVTAVLLLLGVVLWILRTRRQLKPPGTSATAL